MNKDWQKRLRNLPQLYKASQGDIVAIEAFIQSLLDNQAAEVSVTPVGKDEYWGEFWKCSGCEKSNIFTGNFCPDCGAKINWKLSNNGKD